MSDHEVGKKLIEKEILEYFLEAYEYATQTRLMIISSGENPDFLCKGKSGEIIGIELTKIMRDPAVIQDRKLNNLENFMGIILHSIELKECARKKRYCNKSKKTILVLELIDITISESSNFVNSAGNLTNDILDHGFSEIWMADFTELDAFDNVELFCLFPANYWGYYERPNKFCKPYG